MRLNNQVAVITGGASGMGKASAELLASRGLTVVTWDKQESISREEAIELALECDVSSAESVEKAMKRTVDQVGVPRICIHCAGIATGKRMLGKEGPMDLEEFKRVIDINLVGTFNVMRIVASEMAKLPVEEESQERGVIINTASVAAYEGQIGQTAYSASKGGVVGMTLPAARELAQHAIRVNTIAPGLIATPMLLSMPQNVQDSLVESVVFPKRLGKPEEFAALALHIVENSLINGEVIRLDAAIRMQPK